MPTYTVTFSAPMTYLAGHPKEQRVNQLRVVAETPTGALQHAIRVTQGDGLAEEVRECPDA